MKFTSKPTTWKWYFRVEGRTVTLFGGFTLICTCSFFKKIIFSPIAFLFCKVSITLARKHWMKFIYYQLNASYHQINWTYPTLTSFTIAIYCMSITLAFFATSKQFPILHFGITFVAMLKVVGLFVQNRIVIFEGI